MITPKDYVGAIMELSQGRRGDFVDMQYMTEERTTLVYDLPLAEVGKGGSERQRVPEGFWRACLAAAQAAPADVVLVSGRLQQSGAVHRPGL